LVPSEKISEADTLKWADLDLIRFEFGAADLRASLLEFVRDDETISAKSKDQIKGGMDRLPTGFIDPIRAGAWDLSEFIEYHARVKRIVKGRQANEYEIEYEHTITHSSQSRLADYVILAAPFSALTHVRLNSVLPPESLHAIRTLHYENAAKIILEFSEKFWEKLGINGGRSFTDLPIRWTHYPSKEQWGSSTRGLLLASYTWGDDSLRWGCLSEDDRIRFALRDVAEMHNIPIDECKRLLVGGMSHSWAEDEYTFGAFAIFEPHQERELYRNSWKQYEGIHFAGEHTSLKHAWIEGAVESGIRVAKEVLVKAEVR
jgi:monoamine oxidase